MGRDPKPSRRQAAASRRMRSAVEEYPQVSAVPEFSPVERLIMIECSQLVARLATLTQQPDGFLKIGFDDYGDTNWLTFRWTKGKWSGYYVFMRCNTSQLAEGLERLLIRVEMVQAGVLTPTFDAGPRDKVEREWRDTHR